MCCNFSSIGTSFADNKLIQLFKLSFVAGILGIAFRAFICFLQLLNHVAFAFATAFRLILIYTKVFCDVILVYQVINYWNDRYN